VSGRSGAIAAAAALLLCVPAIAAGAQAGGDFASLVRREVTLTAPATLDGAGISELRAAGGPQLGDTMVCLRLAGERPGYLAVFFEGTTVLSYRRAVAVDRCESATYTALAPAVVATVGKPAQRRQAVRVAAPKSGAATAHALPAGR
jgi:hypothetical protein